MQIFADPIAGNDTKLSNCLLQHFVPLELLAGIQMVLDSPSPFVALRGPNWARDIIINISLKGFSCPITTLVIDVIALTKLTS